MVPNQVKIIEGQRRLPALNQIKLIEPNLSLLG